MGEQNGTAVPRAWLSPQRPDGLYNLNAEGRCVATGLGYGTACELAMLINGASAAPAVQPVAYMVEGAGGARSLVWPGDFRAVHAAGAPSPGTVYTPLVPLAAPQAGAAPHAANARDGVKRRWAINEIRAELAAAGDDGLVSLRVDTAEWLLGLLETPGGAAPVDAREREEDARVGHLVSVLEDAACWYDEMAGDDGERSYRRRARTLRSFAKSLPRYAIALRGALPDTRVQALDGAMHSVWLHGNWRWLTQQMTTPQREAAADAVLRYSTALEPDDPVDPDRWWRTGTALSGTPEQPASDAPAPVRHRPSRPLVPYADFAGRPTLNPEVQPVSVVTDPETLDITAPPAQGGET